MRRALLDVNVLLALLDADHVDHSRARDMAGRGNPRGMGFVRIVSQPRYPSPVSPTLAIKRLSRATRTEHHAFWDCDASLLDERIVDRSRVHGPRQVTDVYLLALAVAKGGCFVTFDRYVPVDAVVGAGESSLMLL